MQTIHESDWYVKNRKTREITKISGIIVPMDDIDSLLKNSYFLNKIYRKIYNGEETRKKAIQENRLLVVNIIINEKIIGYANY